MFITPSPIKVDGHVRAEIIINTISIYVYWVFLISNAQIKPTLHRATGGWDGWIKMNTRMVLRYLLITYNTHINNLFSQISCVNRWLQHSLLRMVVEDLIVLYISCFRCFFIATRGTPFATFFSSSCGREEHFALRLANLFFQQCVKWSKVLVSSVFRSICINGVPLEHFYHRKLDQLVRFYQHACLCACVRVSVFKTTFCVLMKLHFISGTNL